MPFQTSSASLKADIKNQYLRQPRVLVSEA
jgi:hypothetical protein